MVASVLSSASGVTGHSAYAQGLNALLLMQVRSKHRLDAASRSSRKRGAREARPAMVQPSPCGCTPSMHEPAALGGVTCVSHRFKKWEGRLAHGRPAQLRAGAAGAGEHASKPSSSSERGACIWWGAACCATGLQPGDPEGRPSDSGCPGVTSVGGMGPHGGQQRAKTAQKGSLCQVGVPSTPGTIAW